MVPQLGACPANSAIAAGRSDVLTDPEGRLSRGNLKGLQIPDFRHWRAVSQERNDRKKQFSQGETIFGRDANDKLALPFAGAAAFTGNSPDFRQKRLSQRPDIKKRGKGDLTSQNRRFRRQRRHLALKHKFFRMHQPASMANTPAVTKETMRHRLAHGLTAEQHGFDSDEFGGLVEIGFQPAGQGSTVEEDGFLRQPMQLRTRPGGNAGGHGGGA